jgi:Transposase domain (DUF772)
MRRFVEGEDRSQTILFPERLDHYVAEDNPVRAIEVFVESLDLRRLGFEGVEPEATGRPAYHPSTLLKIYIYGYLNRIQSSRRTAVFRRPMCGWFTNFSARCHSSEAVNIPLTLRVSIRTLKSSRSLAASAISNKRRSPADMSQRPSGVARTKSDGCITRMLVDTALRLS